MRVVFRDGKKPLHLPPGSRGYNTDSNGIQNLVFEHTSR